ncbi:MAG: hypothetical protein H2069_02160 [Legionella sp.]|nr:hypothetical protein [Legionella sp.]
MKLPVKKYVKNPKLRFILDDRQAWLFAQEHLGNSETKSGTKLLKTKNYNFYKVRGMYHQLPYSFMNIDEKVYKIRSLIGKGAQGRVKLVEDQDGNLFTLKISKEDKENKEHITNELNKSKELKLLSAFIENRNKKTYQLIPYKGISLKKYLQQNCEITIEKKCDLAIKVAITIVENHFKGFAHRDIKPDNITVDLEGNVHLIDFAYAEKLSPHPIAALKGTRAYFPPSPKEYSNLKLDIMAFLRTCFMPDRVQGYLGEQLKTENVLSIFNKQDINHHSVLKNLFCTSYDDVLNKTMPDLNQLDMLSLIEVLICVKFGIDQDAYYSKLKEFNMQLDIKNVNYLNIFNQVLEDKNIKINKDNMTLAQTLYKEKIPITQKNMDLLKTKMIKDWADQDYFNISEVSDAFSNSHNRKIGKQCLQKKIPLTKECFNVACRLNEADIAIDQKNIELGKALLSKKLDISKDNFRAFEVLDKKEITLNHNNIIRALDWLKGQHKTKEKKSTINHNLNTKNSTSKNTDFELMYYSKINANEAKILVENFKVAYTERLKKDKAADKKKLFGCFFSLFRGFNSSAQSLSFSRLINKVKQDHRNWQKKLQIKDLKNPQNVLNDPCLRKDIKQTRTLSVFFELGWMDKNGKITQLNFEPSPLSEDEENDFSDNINNPIKTIICN